MSMLRSTQHCADFDKCLKKEQGLSKLGKSEEESKTEN